jgi:hypothetical protein
VIDADLATVSGAADKVLRVGEQSPWLLHLEFQSGHDSTGLPRLVMVRSALLHHRHQLPVRSVAVLLRPEAGSPRVNGVLEIAFPGREPYAVFRYEVIRVWQMAPETLLRGCLGTLPLAPISDVTEEQLPAIIQRMEQLWGGFPGPAPWPSGRRSAKDAAAAGKHPLRPSRPPDRGCSGGH